MKEYKENPLRTLARSDKWQALYNASKEMHGIRLFYNKIDFTPLQLAFLKWLEIYNFLYTEKSLGNEMVDDKVIEDEILCDAFLLWYSKNKNEKDKHKQQKKNTTQELNGMELPTIKFV